MSSPGIIDGWTDEWMAGCLAGHLPQDDERSSFTYCYLQRCGGGFYFVLVLWMLVVAEWTINWLGNWWWLVGCGVVENVILNWISFARPHCSWFMVQQ